MTLLEALILGLIQGLSEFLPISSSGHLEIGKEVLGTDLVSASDNLFFTITVHAATALSTIVVFRKDIASILWDLYTRKYTDTTNFVLFIVLSMLPAAAVGVFLKDEIESLFTGNMLLVGAMLLVTASLLFSTSFLKPRRGILDYKKSFIIGIAQAIAIIPGISRSGATIGTGLLLGINRSEVARFSFLMVIPLIFGAMAKEIIDHDPATSSSSIDPLALVVGFVAAFVAGLFACRVMINLVRRSKLWYFGFYCALAGGVAIISHFLSNG
jgi:undecaprenyl-diphosphatase